MEGNRAAPGVRTAFVGGALAVAFALLPGTASADNAVAEVRFASPAGGGAAPCTTQATPCSLPDALTAADNMDLVVVGAGTYNVAGLPTPDAPAEAVTIAGAARGAARPVVNATGPLTLVNANSVAGDIDLRVTHASTTVGGLDLQAGATAERMVVRSNHIGCTVRLGAQNAEIKNTVCVGGDSFGLHVNGDGAPAGASATVRSSTIFARSDDAIFVQGGSGVLESASLSGVNVIAQTLAPSTGGTPAYDVNATGPLALNAVSATLSSSNYDTAGPTGGANFATITAPGSGNNQTAPPAFLSTAAGAEDLHQATTSPTINAGVNDAANGPLDVDGQPRVSGLRTDIGADEIVAVAAGGGGGPGVRVVGTPGNDRLTGTPGNDVIVCGAGDDVVNAGGGNDVIDCGDGNDRVNAGAGNDIVLGGRGNDRLVGVIGNDRLGGGPGNDRIGGGSGRDAVSGDAGGDRVSGNSGRDRLGGGTGNDRLSGGSANDRASGGSGRDSLSGNSGNDRLSGNSGNDRVSGNAGNDRVSGNAGSDRLAGGAGADSLSGGAGRDRLSGNSGNDRLRGGRGLDVLLGGGGVNLLRQS